MKEKCFRVDLDDTEWFIPASNIAGLAQSTGEVVLYLRYPLNERKKFTITDPTAAAMVSVWLADMGGLY